VECGRGRKSKATMRTEDIPPHLRPEEPKHRPAQIPLQDLPPDEVDPGREEKNEKKAPPEPFLRRG
jgi:hypothetical protein